MHYYFADQLLTATGLIDRDPNPQHVHCESVLELNPQSGDVRDAPEAEWRCPDCHRTGQIQFLPAHIERRTSELPDPPAMPNPPTSPLA